MAIYVTGDTHGFRLQEGFLHRLSTKNFPEQKDLTKDDFVVILGDFGGVWEANRYTTRGPADERCALDWLEDKPFTTLFVPGNHENYDRLTGFRKEALDGWLFRFPDSEPVDGYPRQQWHGGAVRRIRPSVLMLEPGVFDLDGCRCFAYGGAPSHDIRDGILDPNAFPDAESFKRIYRQWTRMGKQFRVAGVSWWPQEIPGAEQMAQARAALSAVQNTVDFVFSHDCPASVSVLLGFYDDSPVKRFLEDVRAQTEYRRWYFGHYHIEKIMPGGREIAMYQNISRIA